LVDVREVGAGLGQVGIDGGGRVDAAKLGGSPVEVPSVDIIGSSQAVCSDVCNIELVLDVLIRAVEDGRVATGGVESVGARRVQRESHDRLSGTRLIGVEVDLVSAAESLVSLLVGIGVAHVDDRVHLVLEALGAGPAGGLGDVGHAVHFGVVRAVSAVGELAVGRIVGEGAPNAIVATTANAALAVLVDVKGDGRLGVGVVLPVSEEVLRLQEGEHAELLGEGACEEQGHERDCSHT